MSFPFRRVALLCLLGVFSGVVGCGNQSFIVLAISVKKCIDGVCTTCEVANEVEELHVEVFKSVPECDQRDLDLDSLPPEDLLADRRIELVPENTFPFEVLLEPNDLTPPCLRERVTASRGTATAQITIEHSWEESRVNRAPVQMEIEGTEGEPCLPDPS